MKKILTMDGRYCDDEKMILEVNTYATNGEIIIAASLGIAKLINMLNKKNSFGITKNDIYNMFNEQLKNELFDDIE